MYFDVDGYNALKRALHQMCNDFTEAQIPESAVFDCKLAANELLSNALRYGGGRARFTAVRNGDVIKISVKSAADFRPPENSSCSGVEAECGRGLFLVDSVCEARLYSEEEGISVVIRIAREQ